MVAIHGTSVVKWLGVVVALFVLFWRDSLLCILLFTLWLLLGQEVSDLVKPPCAFPIT